MFFEHRCEFCFCCFRS